MIKSRLPNIFFARRIRLTQLIGPDFESVISAALTFSHIRHHPNVAFLSPVVPSAPSSSYSVWNYDVYHDRVVSRRRLWDRDESDVDLFRLFPMSGKLFRVGAIPYGFYVTADPAEVVENDNRMFENFDGYEVKMLKVSDIT